MTKSLQARLFVQFALRAGARWCGWSRPDLVHGLQLPWHANIRLRR